MQLYKSRDFSLFFSDTFEFIKQNGKHFFRNFVYINGFLILILGAITYVFSSFFLEGVLEGLTAGNGTSNLDVLIDSNPELFFGLLSALVIMWLIFGIISYAFTPIYFKLYENANNTTTFSSKDIINSYKINSGKLLSFVGLGILIGIPLLIAFGVAALVVAITIIGILLLPLLVGLLAGLYNMTLLEYLDHKRGFFDSFGYVWSLIISKFWHAVGCMGIFYLMSYVVQMALSIFQSGLNLTSQLTIPNVDNMDADSNIIFIVLTLVIFIISFFVGVILNAILQINQSIVYFGLKEDVEHINTKSDIDLIGLENEL